ncbi:hypothetical protein HXX76_001469 [Chlamydomonas incerta]|uniref:Protein kinase domain-containing protein n=1 Tax=Chlamydomonas incerta TaxID=51695 RepID=A0A836B174_CHLIN|nr:hypothetical protein HXX76_001469 [Chlamydomonas incerta]|eukprot:KAG2444725.1 hypothetical protein HXX76_001469 [Chlamydomonas incerta]
MQEQLSRVLISSGLNSVDSLADTSRVPSHYVPSGSLTTCAVPLFEGNAVAGALVLEAEAPAPTLLSSTTACSQAQQAPDGGSMVAGGVTSSAAGAPLPAQQQQQRQQPTRGCLEGIAAPTSTAATPLAPLLTNPGVLQQLGLAASVCGLGSDAEQLRWTAAALARVTAANSMHALVHELCADVASHVRRRFFVTASVRAALLPHPDAAVGLLFHPQQAGSSLTARTSRDGRYAATGSTLELTASHTALRSARSSVEVPGGPAHSPLAPLLVGSGVGTVVAIIPGATAGGGANGGGGGGGGGGGSRLAPLSSMASRQRLNMLINTGGSSECGVATRFSRQQQQLAAQQQQQQPASVLQHHGALSHFGIDVSGLTNTSSARALVINSDANAVTATANVTAPAFITARVTDPSLPLPTGTLSAGTNVTSGGGFPLAAAIENMAGGNAPSTPVPTRAIVVQLPQNLAPDAVPAPSLHAQAFPLKHTMLHALAVASQQQQQQQQAPPGADVAVPEDQAAAPPHAGFRGSCVEDVAQYVQNVHNPSRDVCLLAGGAGTGGRMGSSLGAMSPRAPGSHCPSPFTVLPTSLVNTGGPGQGLQAASTPGGAAQASAAAMNASAGLSTLTVPPGASSVTGSGLQSLLLVGLRHGQAVLAMYLCFSKRLPGELLEAARASCQELLDQMFLEPVCAKLDGSLAPEFETLRSTTPGHFAVLRPASTNGMFGHQLLGGGSSLNGVASQPPGLAGSGGSGPQHHLALNFSTLGMLPHSHSQGLQISGGRPTSQSGFLPKQNQTSGAPGAGAGAGAGAMGSGLPRTQSSMPRFCGGSGGVGAGDSNSGPATASVLQTLRRGVIAGKPQGLAAAGSALTAEAGLTSPGAGDAAAGAAAAAAGAGDYQEAAVVRDLNRTGTSPAVMAQPCNNARRGSIGGPAVVCCSILSNLEAGTNTGTGGIQTPTKGMPRTVSFNLGDGGLTPTGCARTGPIGTPQGRYNSSSNNKLHRGLRGPSVAIMPMAGGEGSAGALGSGVEPPTVTTNEELVSATVVPPEAQLALCGGGAGGEGAFVVTANSTGLETAGSASIITVVGVETGASMRQQLDLLLTSIHTTMTAEVVNNGVVAAHADDLEQLELVEVLGKGGGGIVYRGRMGTQEVAVKVMELPDVDAGEKAANGQQQQQQQGSPAASPGGAAPWAANANTSNGGLLNPVNAAALAKEQLRARRALLRNAMEMAVQVRVSHPNVIQVYATYSNVLVEQRLRPDGSSYGCLVSTGQCSGLEPAAAGLPGSTGPTHCAIVTELADGGSLAALLTARLFPRVVVARGGPAQPDRHPFTLDLRGVYMVLLDVALALRHLHSMNLVHRDLKPANLLLKSNPRDYRGFTVKLADFGFVLHMSEVAEDGTRYVMVDQACGTVTHMAPELLPGKARVEASADVYSFGILCWELVAGGIRPFPHLHPDLIPRHVYKGARPTFSESIPFTYRGLAQACWAADPSRRPKASDLVAVITNQLQELENAGY